MARGAAPSRASSRTTSQWREQQTAPLAVTEVPLLYETGGDARFDKVVVITAPKALREARREPLPGDRETRLIDDKEKVEAGGLRVREHGLARGARPVRQVRRR